MNLSDRIRPACEAAPWVVEEVKKLERELAALQTENAALAKAFHCLEKKLNNLL